MLSAAQAGRWVRSVLALPERAGTFVALLAFFPLLTPRATTLTASSPGWLRHSGIGSLRRTRAPSQTASSVAGLYVSTRLALPGAGG